MTLPIQTLFERGAEIARQHFSRFGAVYVLRQVEKDQIYGISCHDWPRNHPEAARGYRSEVAALTALASRRAPR